MWSVVAVFFAAMFCISEWMLQDRIAISVARLYLGWWAVCLAASLLNPMASYSVSYFAYFLLLLNVGMFMAGFVASGNSQTKEVGPDAYRSLARSFREQVETSRPVLFFLVGLSVVLLRYYLRYLDVLADVGPSQARNIRFSIGMLFGSAFEALIYNYFIEAIAIALIVIVAYSLVLGSVRNWVFVCAVVNLYLFTSIGAGRTLVVEGFIFILLLATLRNTLQPRSGEGDGRGVTPAGQKSLLVSVVFPAVVMTVLMVYLTYARMFSLETSLESLRDGELLGAATQAFLYQLLTYTTGPFRALDYSLSHPSLFGFHFGRLTFGAVDEMIGYPFRMLGFDYPIINHQVGDITQDSIFIGSGEFNALYTCVFRFYHDFGIPGVVVLSFLFGAALRGAVQWFEGSPSTATLSILLFLFGVSILSTQVWHLSSPASVVFLFGAYLVQRRTEVDWIRASR